MNIVKKCTAVLALCFLVALGSTGSVKAFNLFPTCNSGGGGSSVCTSQRGTNPLTETNGLLINVTHLIAIIAGVVAIIIIIISGIKFITSQGEADKAAGARTTLINAAIGLVVIVLAQAIITFVIGNFIKN